MMKSPLIICVSDLKARLDDCKEPARICENLNFCFPAQTQPFHYKYSKSNFFDRFLDFSQQHVIKRQMGMKI
jgi:hypothetical protein